MRECVCTRSKLGLWVLCFSCLSWVQVIRPVLVVMYYSDAYGLSGFDSCCDCEYVCLVQVTSRVLDILRWSI